MPTSEPRAILIPGDRVTKHQPVPPPDARRQPASARGQVWMAEDFDAPLDDFKDFR